MRVHSRVDDTLRELAAILLLDVLDVGFVLLHKVAAKGRERDD